MVMQILLPSVRVTLNFPPKTCFDVYTSLFIYRKMYCDTIASPKMGICGRNTVHDVNKDTTV